MQLSTDSEIVNKKRVFLYLLVFRWISLGYVLLFLITQKSFFKPYNYWVFYFAILYLFVLTLFQNTALTYVSQKPVFAGIDLTLCLLFVILGGWPKTWFFYSLTPIIISALFWGYIQGFIFTAIIGITYMLSVYLNGAYFIGEENFIRFDSFVFPVTGVLFAAALSTLLFRTRNTSLGSFKELQSQLSQSDDKLKEAEARYFSKIVELVHGAASVISRDEPIEVLSALAESAKKLIKAQKIAVALFDRKSGIVKIDAQTLVVKGRKDQHLESWWKEEFNKITKDIVSKERYQESDESSEEGELATDYVFRKSNKDTSMICVPIQARNRFIGILSAFNAYPYFFTDSEINVLSAIADQAAAVLSKLKRSRERPKAKNSELEREIEDITTRCLQAQEAERKRISRELHDNTAQSLTHLVIRLQKLDASIPNEQTDLKKTMSKLIGIAERTLEEVHEMAFQMRPAILEDLGLVETINWYISHYLGTATLTVNFASAEKEVKLPPHVEIAVLRIIQEALTNIRKYAHASEAFVKLDLVDEELLVSIEDNGEGFDVEKIMTESAEKKSLGLKGMAERTELLGGSLEIISQPGEGTKITATVPLRIRK